MQRTLRLISIATALVAVAACGDSEPVLMDGDGGPMPETDGGPMPDPDAGPTPDPDAGPTPDAGPVPDAGPPPPACPATELTAPADPTAGGWDTSFNMPGVGGTAPADALALAVGPSGEVYVGGMFSHAGSTEAANVVKWTPAGWEALGDGIEGDVLALAIDPTGSPLYAAAQMHATYEVEIHRWDGTSWSTLATVTAPEFGVADVEDLQVGDDGSVYVAGMFGGIGGVDTVANFAVYDGTTWSGLGDGNPDRSVSHVLVDSTGVCIGGMFENVGTTVAQNVACWNGTAWTAYDIPVAYHEVRVLARDGAGALIAGGHFTLDVEDTSQGGALARWTGSGWEYIGGGVHSLPGAPGYVEGIAVVGSDIYVGGYFNAVGPTEDELLIRDVAMWDGTDWHDLGGASREMGIGLIEQNVWRVAADDAGNVYFTGMFTAVGNKSASHVALWDGSYWQTLGAPGQLDAGVNGNVLALAARGGCGVYVGGDFTYAGDVIANNIALFDETGFHTLGDGVNGYVSAIAVAENGDVFVGGNFTGPGFYHLARWNGTDWSSIGNTMAPVTALAIDDAGNLYVAGEFEVAGDTLANHIAMYDGTEWHALGDGVDGDIRAMIFDDAGDLVVAGKIDMLGDEEAGHILRWDGTEWSKIGDGLPGGWTGLRSLAAYDGQLVAGGGHDALADGGKGVAVWDGTEWTSVGGGLHTRWSWSAPYVNALLPVGDVLFAAGDFAVADGEESVRIAYYDGTGWVAMGAGMNDFVETGLVTDAGVWIGGTFTKADRTPSVALALWRWEE